MKPPNLVTHHLPPTKPRAQVSRIKNKGKKVLKEFLFHCTINVHYHYPKTQHRLDSRGYNDIVLFKANV